MSLLPLVSEKKISGKRLESFGFELCFGLWEISRQVGQAVDNWWSVYISCQFYAKVTCWQKKPLNKNKFDSGNSFSRLCANAWSQPSAVCQWAWLPTPLPLRCLGFWASTPGFWRLARRHRMSEARHACIRRRLTNTVFATKWVGCLSRVRIHFRHRRLGIEQSQLHVAKLCVDLLGVQLMELACNAFLQHVTLTVQIFQVVLCTGVTTFSMWRWGWRWWWRIPSCTFWNCCCQPETNTKRSQILISVTSVALS